MTSSDHDIERSISNEKDKHGADGVHTSDGAIEDGGNLKWTITRCFAIAALCLVYVGAQEILYFVGGALSYISADINTNIGNWLLTSNTLAVAAICPFVGYMTDMLGRKWVTVFGAVCLVVSCAVLATAHSLGAAIVSMTIGGVGAGICELTALAGVAEITPVRWRGVTLSLVTFSIVPFMPYLIYIEEIQRVATWRYLFLLAGLWNFLGLVGIIFCYSPPPRHNADGLTKMELLKQIDYIGAFLSIGGVTLFLVGLQFGGYQYPWTDGKTLGPLIVGLLMILAFPIWEWKGAKHPMVPGDIFRGQKVVGLAFGVVFIAGMFFYSILGFFPVMLQALYPPDPITTGLHALGYPLAILTGACLVNALLSFTNGHIRQMFTISAVIMTAFGGALAAGNPTNPAYTVAMATIASFGVGAIIVPALSVALYACPDRYIGTTTALSLSSRFLGGSIGTAIYYNIFNTNITAKLPNYVATAAIGAGLPAGQVVPFLGALLGPGGGAAAASMIQGVTPQILMAAGGAVQWAYSDSLMYVWYTTIAFGVISIGMCACLPNIKQFMSNRVAVDLH